VINAKESSNVLCRSSAGNYLNYYNILSAGLDQHMILERTDVNKLQAITTSRTESVADFGQLTIVWIVGCLRDVACDVDNGMQWSVRWLIAFWQWLPILRLVYITTSKATLTTHKELRNKSCEMYANSTLRMHAKKRCRNSISNVFRVYFSHTYLWRLSNS